MRIAIWNMNYCMRSHEAHLRAWDYLREGLRADLALVQEASPPPEYPAAYRPIGEKPYDWGSAVVALRPDLVLHPRPRVLLQDCHPDPVKGDHLPDSHPGACSVADVLDAQDQHLFTAVSLYGQWEVMADGKTMYSCARLHRMISDLTGVLAASRRRPLVLGGDLNMTTQVAYSGQTQVETDGAAVVFARLRAWGLADCIACTRDSRAPLAGCTCPDRDCAHVRTYRNNNRSDSRPTQLDYAFLSKPIMSTLSACQVVDDEAAWALSDHCPIVLTLMSK